MSATGEVMISSLSLSESERTELLVLLERELRDSHVEARRTESPDFQGQVHEHEAIIHGLLDKLRPR
jgi:hypothetical protein